MDKFSEDLILMKTALEQEHVDADLEEIDEEVKERKKPKKSQKQIFYLPDNYNVKPKKK